MDNTSADTHFVLPMVLKEKMQAIATSLDNDGLVPRVNKNSKRQPNHSLTYDDRERIKQVLVNMQETVPYRSQTAFQISRSRMCCFCHQIKILKTVMKSMNKQRRKCSVRTFQRA